MTNEEVIKKINEALADEFEADPAGFVPEASLVKTLDLDSLDLVDVVVIVEQNFGIVLSQSDFHGIKTFGDFYRLIIDKLDGKS